MNIDLLIYRISSGKLFFTHRNESLILVPASVDLRYEAESIYENIIEDNLYENWLRKNELGNLLKKLDIWDESGDKLLKQVEKSIEKNKMSLYQNRALIKKVESIRKDLLNYKSSLVKLLEKKHYLDYLTLEEYAQARKTEFLISRCLFYKDKNRRYITDLKNHDVNDLNSIISKINNTTLSLETYKKIVISEQWRKIWNYNKTNVFEGKSSAELTEEQQNLINISLMYDRIYENPECPPESVIQDSDMLDGWMLDQKRQIEEQKKKTESDNIANRHKDAKEVFIVADQEEVEDIMNLNDRQGRSIIRNRANIINNSTDLVNVGSLPDVQMDLIQQRSRNR